MNDIMYINASRSPLVPSVYILWGIKWWHLKGIMPPPKTCLLNPGMEKKNESIVKPGPDTQVSWLCVKSSLKAKSEQ